VAAGIPLLLTVFLIGRPIRYGLAIGAILLVVSVYDWANDQTVFADRSYFGVLRVKKQSQEGIDYNTLIHGHINHGMNFEQPGDPSKRGNPEYDFSRLATTYYHRKGPAGIVMEKYNWFPDHTSNNTFWADARMPASLVGMGANPFNFGSLPLEQLVDLWSEPPYATIGLGTGTMASYARPFQHMHYYEIDNHILRLSAPAVGKQAKTYFTYLREAKNRGAEIWVFMGDARLRMAQPYEWDWDETRDDHDNAYGIKVIDGKVGGGPENFYHMMVVDAFSSDAIPIHLLTKQAVEMYFKKLSEEGILCVHTSNRYVELVPVVADIANSLGLAYMRGHDQAPQEDKGHFTSEWVMVARKSEYMRHLEAPENYQELLRAAAQRGKRVNPGEPYWEIPTARGRHVWTDDYSNLIAVLR
jgi:hypothetical protein